METRYHGLSQGGCVGASDASAAIAQAPTSIQVAQNAMAEAIEISLRVQRIVERLCGAVPTTEKANGGNCISGSVFAELRDSAEYAVNHIRSGMSALDRLERELP